MRKLVAAAAVTFAASFAALPASGSVVTFNSFFSSNAIQTGTQTIEGFDFTSAHWHVVDTFSCCVAPTDGNYLGLDGPALAFPVTMADSTGGTFSLTGFMGNELWNVVPPGGFSNAQSIEVTGHVHGGGTLTASFQLDGMPDVWQAFSLVGWDNLDSVVFGGNENQSIAIDSIVVNAAAIPEPGTLLLVGASVLAFAARRRRG